METFVVIYRGFAISEEFHAKRAFVSDEHAFQPRLRKSLDNVASNSRRQSRGQAQGSRSRDSVIDLGPPHASSVSGSSHADAVRAVVEESKRRQEARAGSAFAGRPHSLAAPIAAAVAASKAAHGSAHGSPGKEAKEAWEESRFEALYQHGVQRGLVRLSAQVTLEPTFATPPPPSMAERTQQGALFRSTNAAALTHTLCALSPPRVRAPSLPVSAISGPKS